MRLIEVLVLIVVLAVGVGFYRGCQNPASPIHKLVYDTIK